MATINPRFKKTRTATAVAAGIFAAAFFVGVGVSGFASAALPATPGTLWFGASDVVEPACFASRAAPGARPPVVYSGPVPWPVRVDGPAQLCNSAPGYTGYTRGPGWTRWRGRVALPAGRWVVDLAGGNARSVAMIDRATIAPVGVGAVQGPRAVILTGPEVVSAEVDWSGSKLATIVIGQANPVPAAVRH